MKRRGGVLLFNLGGPERLEDVRPFLRNLFSDPEILRIKSAPLRNAVAWLIAATRNKKSQGYYEKIGGGSPLRRITEAQAAALSERLDMPVYVGMRAWHPTIDEALERIVADRIEELVLLPLYPQFSFATTGSSLRYFEEVSPKLGFGGTVHVIRQWHEEPAYIECLARSVHGEFSRFSDPNPEAIHLLYSAHSIPERYVLEGDPYLEQTKRTVELVNGALGGESAWTLAFQSKVGPVKWLEPSTQAVIASLARDRVKQVLVVPVSFVSDHIETLYELDILYRDLAAEAGIPEFRRVPALNEDAGFIAALAGLVRRAIS